jgi:deoxyribodipyrimidine photo-lyase
MNLFEPTLEAAHARLAAVNPTAYARTRNALDGAVTRLSPYLTHGMLSLKDVYDSVHARQPLDSQHKLVFELGWRAYWQHVWAHLGDGVHQSLRAGLLPDSAYQPDMPADVLEARTGIPAIDLAVRQLYATGYLHNHARMWLASYLVHLRKVHWHAGAQWMLGHLLDGDVASNHLSWQWVAGTGSSKPYLFNADNVSKYATAQWHSPGTAIDTSYEALDAMARGNQAIDTRFDARRADAGMAQPALCPRPAQDTADNPALWLAPDAPESPAAQETSGRDVWLHHPWSLHADPSLAPAGALHIGLGLEACHTATPWSARRWDFVTRGLQAQTTRLWWGDAAQIARALQHAKSVHWQANPHADRALAAAAALLKRAGSPQRVGPRASPCLFEPVNRRCRSFSEWWKQTRIAP